MSSTRLKVPVAELIKTVEKTIAKAETQIERDIVKWETTIKSWHVKAADAILAKANELYGGQLISTEDLGTRYNKRKTQTISVTVPVHPGSRPVRSNIDRMRADLRHLKATDQTHITVDPGERMDHFGHYISNG